MSKLYVEYRKVAEGKHITDIDALYAYCKSSQQDSILVHDVLTGFDRVEYYIKDEQGNTVGVFFITVMVDMHHGKIAILAAQWFAQSIRNSLEAHKLMLWYVKRFCQTHGIRKYQRTVNLSSCRQLLITKEV